MELLSVIIPVYNEERSVAELVKSVLDVDLSDLSLEKELVIINDASTDHTLRSLERFKGDPRVMVITHTKNSGKGAAVNTGTSPFGTAKMTISAIPTSYAT